MPQIEHGTHEELILEVEKIKNILMDCATGRSSNDLEYTEIRQRLIVNERIKTKLPQFVRRSRNLGQFWSFIQPKFSTYAERRTYLSDQFEPILDMLEMELRAPNVISTNTILKIVDAANVREAWEKALDRKMSDPSGAITASRTLLESVCKYILDQNNIEYEDQADLPKLYSDTAKLLNLAPSQHTEKIFKQILGSSQAVVEGLGALRNRLGDAHGKGSTSFKAAPRHAELAVNLSGTMATFLLTTWETQKSSPRTTSKE